MLKCRFSAVSKGAAEAVAEIVEKLGLFIRARLLKLLHAYWEDVFCYFFINKSAERSFQVWDFFCKLKAQGPRSFQCKPVSVQE